MPYYLHPGMRPYPDQFRRYHCLEYMRPLYSRELLHSLQLPSKTVHSDQPNQNIAKPEGYPCYR